MYPQIEIDRQYVPVEVVRQTAPHKFIITCPHCEEGIATLEHEDERGNLRYFKGRCRHCNGTEQLSVTCSEIFQFIHGCEACATENE